MLVGFNEKKADSIPYVPLRIVFVPSSCRRGHGDVSFQAIFI
jgi:hypothetical protein